MLNNKYIYLDTVQKTTLESTVNPLTEPATRSYSTIVTATTKDNIRNWYLDSTGWLKIYSQTEVSDMFSHCQLASCNIGSGENFINFDALPNMTQYHFKLVWDDGINPDNDDNEMQWKQSQNPLSASNSDMSPTEVLRSPSNTTLTTFSGLSLSSKQEKTLLDGNSGAGWHYSVGYKMHGNKGGNPKYNNAATGATKTQLFVRVCQTGWTFSNRKCIQVFCDGGINWHDAVAGCQAKNAPLLTVDDEQMNILVNK